MIPVQMRIVSSASCTLAEASALLQRFLSSDACSDSFATDYVANVAQALQDSISRRSGGQKLLVAGKSAPHSSHGVNKLIPCGLGHDKQTEQDADASKDIRSAMLEAEHAFGGRKKKRRHSAVKNGPEKDLTPTSEMADSSLMHHDKKRRKKEKHETGTENTGPDDQKHHDRKISKEKQEMEIEAVVTEYAALDNQNLHGKKKRKKEKQGKDVEDMETLQVPEHRGSPVSLPQAKRKAEVSNADANNAPMSAKVEESAGSLKRKRKEGKAFCSATPVKDLSSEKKKTKTYVEASPLELENLASEERKTMKKKRRSKGELGDLVRQTLID